MKKILILIILMMSFSLTSCKLGHIEDTNGDDDYSLCSLTNDDILNGKFVTKTGSVETRLNNKGSLKAKKLSGVETVLNINETNDVNITINFKVEKGNGVIAIVNSNKIVHILEANSTKTYNLLPGGKYSIKIVGESCCFKVSYIIDK